MARTTNYVLENDDLSFARDFIRKQISQSGGLNDAQLVGAADEMDTVLQRQEVRLLSKDETVEVFARNLQCFDLHPVFHGVMGKLRNALRVRNYRRRNGSRKASQKTITISHEAWAVLKTMVKNSDASNLSEAILKLEIPADVIDSISRKS
ncbi:hypothetical protein [Aliamphritea ceti]|uniref:hypothetical protein n=1 Tax=Aliamphritea ceti TaxID=1524258 RepID=UPI0021C277F0|nr:hypothetical protein [Aliamphritea ceti]